MSNIVKDLSSIELETLDNIRSSKSVNTIRAYKSDFNHFVDFCKKNNLKVQINRDVLHQKIITYCTSKGS